MHTQEIALILQFCMYAYMWIKTFRFLLLMKRWLLSLLSSAATGWKTRLDVLFTNSVYIRSSLICKNLHTYTYAQTHKVTRARVWFVGAPEYMCTNTLSHWHLFNIMHCHWNVMSCDSLKLHISYFFSLLLLGDRCPNCFTPDWLIGQFLQYEN